MEEEVVAEFARYFEARERLVVEDVGGGGVGLEVSDG